MNTDISLLFEKPNVDKCAILTIEPLAPLSIVSTLPGSYYKSQNAPTKSNLCGMFENVLGWHIGIGERRKILKNMKKAYKKKFKVADFEKTVSAVGYTSLLGHLFNIELPNLLPAILVRYDDLWKQQMKQDDSRHVKGTPNLSWNLITEKRGLPTDDKGKITDSTFDTFLKENYSHFPLYYTSPTPREFIVLDGPYQYKLSINSCLLESLKESIKDNNIAYLGTNEGWVDLSINEI